MKINLVIALLIMSSLTLSAQSRSDIFDSKTEITWLGNDFSGLKLIGDRERLGSESDILRLMEEWNDIMVTEAGRKFNIALATDRKTVVTKIDVTKEHNAELDVISMYSDDKKDYIHLTKEGVGEIVSGYDFKGLTGIGLMFNVESFSKLNGEAAAWVTFINMETKEVLLTERVIGHPGGGGMRNYWANAIAEIIDRMIKKEFELWRKKSS